MVAFCLRMQGVGGGGRGKHAQKKRCPDVGNSSIHVTASTIRLTDCFLD